MEENIPNRTISNTVLLKSLIHSCTWDCFLKEWIACWYVLECLIYISCIFLYKVSWEALFVQQLLTQFALLIYFFLKETKVISHHSYKGSWYKGIKWQKSCHFMSVSLLSVSVIWKLFLTYTGEVYLWISTSHNMPEGCVTGYGAGSQRCRASCLEYCSCGLGRYSEHSAQLNRKRMVRGVCLYIHPHILT